MKYKNGYYYKVVTKDMQSVLTNHQRGILKVYPSMQDVRDSQQLYLEKIAISYEVDRLNRPKVKGTGLMVFSSLRDAKVFRDSGERIFKCKVINSRKIKRVLSGRSLVRCLKDLDRLKKYWATDFKGTRSISRLFLRLAIGIPDGTFVCDAVKLLEEVT